MQRGDARQGCSKPGREIISPVLRFPAMAKVIATRVKTASLPFQRNGRSGGAQLRLSLKVAGLELLIVSNPNWLLLKLRSSNAVLRQPSPQTKCEVQISYRNQCAAYAWGAGRSVASHAIDIPTATEDALKSCGATAGTTCKIYYSGCSYAEAVPK